MSSPLNKQDSFVLNMPKPYVGEPEISMAPLVDIIFILIIFFVVATVFPHERGITVEKPTSESTSEVDKNAIGFTIDAKEVIYHQQTVVNAAEVTGLVRDFMREHQRPSILLQVDRRVTTEKLIEVMDACKSGGGERIAIATEKK